MAFNRHILEEYDHLAGEELPMYRYIERDDCDQGLGIDEDDEDDDLLYDDEW